MSLTLIRVGTIVVGGLAVVFSLLMPDYLADEVAMIVLGALLVGWALGGMLTEP
jgi:hypothetical protein